MTQSNKTPTNDMSAPPNQVESALFAPALVVLGLPGSGVDTTAERLAADAGLVLRSAEEQMAAEAGKPIADVLIQDGEGTYRDLELAASLWACEHEGIALVGAGMLDHDDFWATTTPTCVVGLDVDVKTALKNLGLGAAASAVINPRATWMRQAEDRRQHMNQRCHHVVDVTDMSENDVVATLTSYLKPS